MEKSSNHNSFQENSKQQHHVAIYASIPNVLQQAQKDDVTLAEDKVITDGHGHLPDHLTEETYLPAPESTLWDSLE